MKNLINYLKALWSRVADSQSSDMRHDCRRSDLRRSPSGLDAKWKQNPFMRFAVVLTLIFTIGVGNAWGETITLTKTSLSLPRDYASSTTSITVSNVGFSYNKLAHYDGSSIQSQATNGELWNTTLVPGKITNVSATHTGTARSSNLYWGTSAKATTNSSSVSGSFSKDSPSGCFGYIYIKRSSNAAYWSQVVITYTPATITLSKSSITGLDYNLGSGPSASQTFTVSGSNIPANLTVTAPTNFEVSLNGSSWASSQTISVTTSGSSGGTLSSTTVYVRLASGKSAGDYSGNVSIAMAGCNTISGVNPKTVAVSGTVTAAACAADVVIGTASLNGSFNLSSVGVQCASITPGSNCAVASGDYGFIWYEGTGNKEIGGSGVTRVNNSGAYSSGAFSNSLTSTFVAGTTYTFRAFAINGKPSTAYSAAVSFTPYTVTFNMNGHGSAIAQQVVNTGGTASTPSAPSATGYTFGGWYQEAECTNAVNWSSTITANKNYYAKWTAKEYTVTLDNESPTVSGSTSVTLTYNSASHAAITNPTKTGYTFAGWWTADNGTGTEVINTSGALQASVSNYTGAGGIWTRDNNSTTLYAKWTAKSFTVTWMVNGESYSAGGSTSVDYGSHVATLPTAPTPPCGNKFMGWTTTNIGSVGLDKDDDAAAITALNLFTTAGSAPTISAEGNVTYYAVFADYAEK